MFLDSFYFRPQKKPILVWYRFFYVLTTYWPNHFLNVVQKNVSELKNNHLNN